MKQAICIFTHQILHILNITGISIWLNRPSVSTVTAAVNKCTICDRDLRYKCSQYDGFVFKARFYYQQVSFSSGTQLSVLQIRLWIHIDTTFQLYQQQIIIIILDASQWIFRIIGNHIIMLITYLSRKVIMLYVIVYYSALQLLPVFFSFKKLSPYNFCYDWIWFQLELYQLDVLYLSIFIYLS